MEKNMVRTNFDFNAVRAGVVIGAIAIGLSVGTGGASTSEYYSARGTKGYQSAQYNSPPEQGDATYSLQPTNDLRHIFNVLKLSVTDLAYALGVSRQAVYDWKNGKAINQDNALRLADLARAADVFVEKKVTMSAHLLRRPIASGKGLLDIAREGEATAASAEKLIKILLSETNQREMLTARIANRKRPTVPIDVDSYGMPMLDEQS